MNFITEGFSIIDQLLGDPVLLALICLGVALFFNVLGLRDKVVDLWHESQTPRTPNSLARRIVETADKLQGNAQTYVMRIANEVGELEEQLRQAQAELAQNKIDLANAIKYNMTFDIRRLQAKLLNCERKITLLEAKLNQINAIYFHALEETLKTESMKGEAGLIALEVELRATMSGLRETQDNTTTRLMALGQQAAGYLGAATVPTAENFPIRLAAAQAAQPQLTGGEND